MTEKDKIANILNSTEISHELSKDDIYKFANALIAAGIGDVKEAKAETMHYWNTRQEVLDELERAEHRAEVAERALRNCVKYYLFTSFCPVPDCDLDDKCWGESCRLNIAKYFEEQAEKELAEEKKDAN